MTSLTDDLQTAQLWARGMTKHDVEIVDDSVYINFDHRCAVVITPQFEAGGKLWFATMTEWDPSGGVHMEMPLADQGFVVMTIAVREWLEAWDEQQRRIDEECNAASDEALAYMQWEQDMYSREAEEESLGRPLFPNEY